MLAAAQQQQQPFGYTTPKQQQSYGSPMQQQQQFAAPAGAAPWASPQQHGVGQAVPMQLAQSQSPAWGAQQGAYSAPPAPMQYTPAQQGYGQPVQQGTMQQQGGPQAYGYAQQPMQGGGAWQQQQQQQTAMQAPSPQGYIVSPQPYQGAGQYAAQHGMPQGMQQDTGLSFADAQGQAMQLPAGQQYQQQQYQEQQQPYQQQQQQQQQGGYLGSYNAPAMGAYSNGAAYQTPVHPAAMLNLQPLQIPHSHLDLGDAAAGHTIPEAAAGGDAYPGVDPNSGPQVEEPSPEALVYGPFYTKPIPQDILSITILKSDPLKDDHLLTNPVIRLHVLDPGTGNYLQNLATPGMLMDPASQAHMLEFAGRPHLVTVNNQDMPIPAVQEYIPPIQTAPYDLLKRSDVRNAGSWREPLLIDEALERLVALDALVIMELMQPAITYRRFEKHAKEYDGGVHRVAWGFLRPQGPGGQPLLGNLRLQLYEYKAGFSSADRPPGHSANTPFHAYSSWQALMASRTPSLLSGSVPKYPGSLHVRVEVVPRPPPDVITTNAFLNVRPRLPAGYGSGFEKGTKSWEALLPGSVPSEGPGGLAALEDLAGWQVPTLEELSRNKYYRRLGEACEVPNALVQQLPTSASGTTAVAFSHNGVFLAGACGDPRNIFHISLWSVLSGSLITKLLHAHNEYVYSLVWSHENDALLSCSSDGTAKVWELQHYSKVTRAIRPNVLRHASFVYAAEFHPNQKSHPFIVTAGYDGLIHLWDRASGQKIVSTKPLEGLPSPINTLVFDALGVRLYAGDSAGRIREYALDVGSIKAARDQERASDPWDQAALGMLPSYGDGADGDEAVAAALGSQSAGGGGQDGADSLNRSLRRQATQTAADAHEGGGRRTVKAADMILRPLRGCDDFEGEGICSLFLHSSGRRLGVLTRGHPRSRYSRLSCLDTKTLQPTGEYQGGLRCKRTPIKASFSPDGNYIMCGSEDGYCYLWDVDGGPAMQLPEHFSLQGQPVLCTAWNKVLNMAVVCGYSSWSPVKVLAFDRAKPPLALPLVKKPRKTHFADETKKANRHYRRYELPEKLTPEMVRGLLSDIRTDAIKRKVIRDPKEEKLVVRQGSVPPREELHTVDQDGHQGKDSRVRQAGHDEGEAVDITLRPWQQQQQQQQHPGSNNTLQQGAQQGKPHLAQGHEPGGSAGGVQGQAQHAGQEHGVMDPTIAADKPDVDDQGRPVIRYRPFGKDATPIDDSPGAPLPPPTAATDAAAALMNAAAAAAARKAKKQEDETPIPPARYSPSSDLGTKAQPSSLSPMEKLLLTKEGEAEGKRVPLPPPPAEVPASREQLATAASLQGLNAAGYTAEEAARLAKHGGMLVVAGPESTVIAGAGSTVVLTPGAAILDAGAVKAQAAAHAAAAAVASAQKKAGGTAAYGLHLEKPVQGVTGISTESLASLATSKQQVPEQAAKATGSTATAAAASSATAASGAPGVGSKAAGADSSAAKAAGSVAVKDVGQTGAALVEKDGLSKPKPPSDAAAAKSAVAAAAPGVTSGVVQSQEATLKPKGAAAPTVSTAGLSSAPGEEASLKPKAAAAPMVPTTGLSLAPGEEATLKPKAAAAGASATPGTGVAPGGAASLKSVGL